MAKEIDEKALLEELERLRQENDQLKRHFLASAENTVSVPDKFKPIFDEAQKIVGEYFEEISFNPSKGTIEINDERYVLVRASALSNDFLKSIKSLYADRGETEALSIGRNFLFDIAHLIGLEDAKNFHKKMNLKDPVAKLSAGPVHFAYSGWAFVDILPESNPTPDENFFLKYNHPFSFEADSWIRAGEVSGFSTCIMNAGYSSGWCEESFGIPLTAVEITCKAKGDEKCTFIMAPPDKIEEYLGEYASEAKNGSHNIPAFFERKNIEEKIKSNLKEKEVMLKEIHHRVKNNLQIISSLLNLQSAHIKEPDAQKKFSDSIGRVRSMAIIHELLYKSKKLSEIDLGEYLKILVRYIRSTYYLDGTKKEPTVQTKINVGTLEIDKAVSVGLILNELISNSLKYNFSDGDKGLIKIDLSHPKGKKGEFYRIVVEDDGAGLPEGFDLLKSNTFGMELVEVLVEQLDGEITIEKPSRGTKITIEFSV